MDPTLPFQKEEVVTKLPRKNFRFSVVPGGVYSANELKDSRVADRVVAEHYSDFGASAERTSLPADAYMYVSYRIADHVYWSKQRHRIPKGEKVLCDGKNLARVRCGNRLSLVPKTPVSPGKEPTEPMLGMLEPPPPPEPVSALPEMALALPEMYLAPSIPGASPILRAPLAGPNLSLTGLESMGAAPRTQGPWFALPSPGMISGKSSTSGSKGSGNQPGGTGPGTPTGTLPIVAVPEPSTFGVGLFGCLLLLMGAASRLCSRARRNA